MSARTCNGCGGGLVPLEAATAGIDDDYGLLDASFSTGYFSTSFPDGETLTFSLCEPCLKHLVDGFVVPPKRGTFL